MFKLESASAHYHDDIVLRDITLQIAAGQKLALVGHSGSGKSTLLKMLYEQRPQDVSVLPQDYGLVQTLSVYHNVYMARLQQYSLWYNLLNLVHPMKKPLQQVRQLVQQLGLQDKLFATVAELSGGQQQRVALARALYQNSAILLADEPVSSLDEQQSNMVMKLMCQQFETVVLAMHDIDLALTYCDRIIGLKQGQIIIDAAASSLQRSDLLALYGE